MPIHPKYLFEFQAVNKTDVVDLALALIRNAKISGSSLFDMKEITLENVNNVKQDAWKC